MDGVIYKLITRNKINPVTNCWEWTGCVDNAGYGRITVRGKQTRVHRVSYEVFNKKIKAELIMHTCDNRRCFNPTHLIEGTTIENIKDRVTKKRSRNQNTGKTHCKRGHAYTKESTFYYKDGRRDCRKCIRLRYLRRKSHGC